MPLNVIVTCSNQMSRPIPTRLQFGQVTGQDAIQRAHRWIDRLARTTRIARTPAVDLYAGEHWSVARTFPAQHLPGEEIHLWACSAGYGLITADTPILPYHATLTPGQADSVPGDIASWWSIISDWRGPSPHHPRSISALVASNPRASFMVVISKSYLRACGPDIIFACRYLEDSDQLFIVSAGTRSQGELAEFIVPADARLQALLGGTRRALNARIGADILAHGIRSKEAAIQYLNQLLAEQPPIPRYSREKQSDHQVLDFIVRHLTDMPVMPASRLLRQFRDAGFACEQHRFNRLYNKLTEMENE
jgi:hypothetical protein